MENNVVFTHEVVGQGVGVVPPLAPGLGVAAAARPLNGGRQVADYGVEPHIQALARLVIPAGDRDTPVNVAAHGARTDFLEDVLGELNDVGAPCARGFTLIQPLA